MSITKSGLYGMTIDKMFTNAAAIDLQLETNKVALVTDTHTPDFDAHDFYADLTNEVPGTGGYTTGGQVLVGTEVTVAAGSLKYDATDLAWAASTIANAMAGICYADAVTDELIFCSDFVTAASTTAGTFTIVWNAAGIFTLSYAP